MSSNPADLPKGGLNSGIVIPLYCCCPPACICKKRQFTFWLCDCCREPLFINQYGDVFCKNFKGKCSGQFIQHEKFGCQEAKNNNLKFKYQSASQCIMAIAEGIAAKLQSTFQDKDLLEFSTSLSKEVISRWTHEDRYDIQTLPKGKYNTGIVISLTCTCPTGCKCGQEQKIRWHHKPCGDPLFINDSGDIFCKNYTNSCSGYFIQNAQFQCTIAKQSNSWEQLKSLSQVLMALSQALQAAELNLGAQAQNQFTNNILTEVNKRWIR